MSQNKTRPRDTSVEEWLETLSGRRRDETEVLLPLLERLAGAPPVLWGANMVGFGTYHYRYASGREGDFFRVGFAPRKAKMTLYIMSGFAECDEILERLGKHRVGKSCLYVNKLGDIDLAVLEELVVASLDHMAERYPPT